MKKQTEIELVKKHPHLYSPKILEALNLQDSSSTASKKSHGLSSYRNNNFFECGEGWLPILQAFAVSLDELLADQKQSDIENEVENSDEAYESTCYIVGATIRNYRLNIEVDLDSESNEVYWGMVESMKCLALNLSGVMCEVCGTQVNAVASKSARCEVCCCREYGFK